MENFFTLDRVVGKSSAQERAEIIKKKEDILQNQQFEDLKGIEAEKSPEILQAINFANIATNDLLTKHGLDSMEIPAQNIHIIKSEVKSASPLSREGAAGQFDDETLRILVAEKNSPQFTHTLIHEILHMKTLHSFDINDEKAGAYKSGLKIKSRNRRFAGVTYFSVLNEAMTEAITKRIVLKAIGEDASMFKGLAKSTQEAFEKHPEATDFGNNLIFDDHLFYAKENKRGLFGRTLNKLLGEKPLPVHACHFSYRREQDILNGLIDKIYERNKDGFGDREDVYLLFEKSYITGNMLQLGTLIDRTFGSGTFRKLGSLSFAMTENQEQKDFLESFNQESNSKEIKKTSELLKKSQYARENF